MKFSDSRAIPLGRIRQKTAVLAVSGGMHDASGGHRLISPSTRPEIARPWLISANVWRSAFGGLMGLAMVSAWGAEAPSTQSAGTKPFKIIAVSDPTITTHEVKSGDFVIGITDNAGGIINEVYLPKLKKNIMGKQAQSYGRAGQVAIRDSTHGGRYNPTQSGFHETLGTQCAITGNADKLMIQPHGVALWHGDSEYDFTRWENIGPDPYKKDGGNSDEDGLEEENVSVVINGITYTKQEAEVYSEFDFCGQFENYLGKYGIETPVIRHYFEFRFIRPPGHCLKEHRAGTKLFNPKMLGKVIPDKEPKGDHRGTETDLTNMMAIWSLRNDRAIWTPKFFYVRTSAGAWSSHDGNDEVPKDSDERAFIIADENKADRGEALGFYRPKTAINDYTIIGVHESSGDIAYRDDRANSASGEYRILLEMFRTPTMAKYGFGAKLTGMLSRNQLPKDVYEAFRAEYFILNGTPKQIQDAIAKIDLIPPVPDKKAFPF